MNTILSSTITQKIRQLTTILMPGTTGRYGINAGITPGKVENSVVFKRQPAYPSPFVVAKKK